MDTPIVKLDGQERIAVPAHLTVPGADNYVLRVVGDSMLDECVMDGDYVIVQRADSARDGQMAVCLVGDDATLKRVYYEGDGRVRLESGRPEHAVIYVQATDVRVQGIVVGLMRRYR